MPSVKTQAKKLISEKFGFKYNSIVMLECDSIGGVAKASYLMFEVCGVQYQVHNGQLSIYVEGR